MSRRHRTVALRAALATALGLLVAVTAPADAAPAKSYAAPYKPGPTGGDRFSYHSAGTDGTITVGRVYPIPGAINCTKGGPYAKLLVKHRAIRPVSRVVLSYDSAAVDNFTFLMLGVRAGHRWLGSTTERGVLTGSGTVSLRLARRQSDLPRMLTVEFGLQQSSACPHADVGTLRVTGIRVFS